MEIPKKREPRNLFSKAANDALEKAIAERRKTKEKEREERNNRLKNTFKGLK